LSKKILIITYYWPPSGGSGVQRWLYFSRFLAKLGWDPIIITVDHEEASYPVIDKSLLKLSKEIRTIKTSTREPLRIYSKLKTGNIREGIPQGQIDNSSFLKRLSSFIRGNFFIPDARKGWNKFAVKAAKYIIENEEINYIITTGPPHSTHLIGLELIKKYSIKWLADFRDPWSEIFYTKDLHRLSCFQKKDEKLEKKVLSSASAILTTTGGDFHKLLRNKINTSQYFFTINNGFDKELLDSISSEKPNFFHIVYTGLLTENHSYKMVIKSIDEISKKYPKESIKFSLAGKIDKSIVSELKIKLPNVLVEYKGYLEHSQAILLMKSAHLLLNFIFKNADSYMISGKTLEYMASNVPILCVGKEKTPVSKLLLKGTESIVVLKNDFDKTYLFINQLTDAWSNGVSKTNLVSDINNFSRKELTKKLNFILKSL